MLLKGKVVKGHGQATDYWAKFPEHYKLLFAPMYPGSLNVEVKDLSSYEELYNELFYTRENAIQISWPFRVFQNEWKEVKYWNKTNYWPVKVNGTPGFHINLDPYSSGRPRHKLEFVLTGEIKDDEVEIEWL